MKNWFILFMIMLVSIMTSCAENVTSSNDGGDDTVLIDSVGTNDAVDSVVTPALKTFVIQAKAVKGTFKNGASITHEKIGDTSTIQGVIADYSTSIVSYTKQVETSLSKEAGTLIKSTVEGKSFNEFSNGISFLDMILQGYTIDTGEDTIEIKLNVISNLVSSKMNNVETIASYNEAKAIVLNDLGLDSNFNINQACDDGVISDEDCGKLLAVGALVMRSSEYDFEASDWDVIPYENTEDEKQSFKYWMQDISHNIFREYIMIDGVTQLRPMTVDEKLDGYKELAALCHNAQKSTETLITGEYRNLLKTSINDETVGHCEDYMYDFYWPLVEDL